MTGVNAGNGVEFRTDLAEFTAGTLAGTSGSYTFAHNSINYNVSADYVKVKDSDGKTVSPGTILNLPLSFTNDATADNDLLKVTVSHPDQAGMQIILFLPEQ